MGVNRSQFDNGDGTFDYEGYADAIYAQADEQREYQVGRQLTLREALKMIAQLYPKMTITEFTALYQDYKGLFK